jgi:hypothetical protein
MATAPNPTVSTAKAFIVRDFIALLLVAVALWACWIEIPLTLPTGENSAHAWGSDPHNGKKKRQKIFKGV